MSSHLAVRRYSYSSSSASSGIESRGQQTQQKHPDFPLPRHLLQLLLVEPKVFPGQPRDIVQSSVSWVRTGSRFRHLKVVEGFECSNDPRCYVVWGLNAPGRVSHGKQSLGDGSDKERFKMPS
ncbi:hypothetical protein ATANTOWER_000575 [Ataeniobius toweri]|uniref:Uncharacterized protein n=1 Tax=Ataeniobius toweri TaxID=208326 RepID=A0ABU7C4S6_9TELE|nr:hypothetical protein [Ataeniobius toweri]